MKIFNLLAIIFSFAIILPGCNFVSDYGNIKNSDTEGYLAYSNKTLNLSVLAPESWKLDMTIGGNYVMWPPNSTRDSISVTSATTEWLMGEGASKSTTLEEYKNHRLSFLTEENIGPHLTVAVNKSMLAGHDAYEIHYSMLPKGETEYLVTQETFTVVDGRIYQLYYYVSKKHYEKYLNELEIIKSSYQIMK